MTVWADLKAAVRKEYGDTEAEKIKYHGDAFIKRGYHFLGSAPSKSELFLTYDPRSFRDQAELTALLRAFKGPPDSRLLLPHPSGILLPHAKQLAERLFSAYGGRIEYCRSWDRTVYSGVKTIRSQQELDTLVGDMRALWDDFRQGSTPASELGDIPSREPDSP